MGSTDGADEVLEVKMLVTQTGRPPVVLANGIRARFCGERKILQFRIQVYGGPAGRRNLTNLRQAQPNKLGLEVKRTDFQAWPLGREYLVSHNTPDPT